MKHTWTRTTWNDGTVTEKRTIVIDYDDDTDRASLHSDFVAELLEAAGWEPANGAKDIPQEVTPCGQEC